MDRKVGKGMQQKEIASWLKGITIIIACMGAVFFLWMLPVRLREVRELYPEAGVLYVPGLVYCAVTAVICYAILYQFWKVCRQIGVDNSFSEENARSLKIMSRLSVLMSLLWFCGLLAAALAGCMHVGIMMRMLFVVFAGIVFGICTAALSHLVLKAYEMKQENDYTI